MKSIVLLITMYTLGPCAYASTKVGNGGVVVVCSSKSGYPEVQILDFVEARLIWDLKIRDFSERLSATEIVQERINDLARFDPNRAERLTKSLGSFFEESRFLKDANLVRTDDEQTIAVPKDCLLDQAVVQIKPNFPAEKRYNISESYWSGLSDRPVEVAGLIFHELIYREAIERGHTTSRRIRYFTAYLFSEQFVEQSEEDYREVLASVGLPLN